MAIAIARSNIGPSFLVFTGAKLIILLLSSLNPEFFIAVLTLSLDSFTLISGRPIISQYGIPSAISTWTSTR